MNSMEKKDGVPKVPVNIGENIVAARTEECAREEIRQSSIKTRTGGNASARSVRNCSQAHILFSSMTMSEAIPVAREVSS